MAKRKMSSIAKPSAHDIAEVRAGRGSPRDRAEVRAAGGLRKLPHKMKRKKKK